MLDSVVYRASTISAEALLRSQTVKDLILPSAWAAIQEPLISGDWWMVEALNNGELLGVCLCEVSRFPFHTEARMHSLMVTPPYRRRGMGKGLLAFTESFLVHEEKIVCMDFFYFKEDAFASVIEKMVAELDWPPAKTSLISAVIDISSFNPSWLYFPFKLPQGVECLAWDSLTAQDVRCIERLLLQGRALPYLNPLVSSGKIDAETSVFLRHREQLVGWSATRVERRDGLEYFSLYVEPSFTGTGAGIKLLAESILRHKQKEPRFALFDINPFEIDPSWAFFVKKRLLPFAIEIKHRKRAFRSYLGQTKLKLGLKLGFNL